MCVFMQGAEVPEPFQERRQPRRFRILYISLEGFLQRFVLRNKVGAQVPPSPSEARRPQTAAPSEKSIPWKCGVTQLDEQNEALFNAIRRYQGALKSGDVHATEEVLAFLEDHMAGHLALEESYMEHIHFPDLAGHRQGHRAFEHQVHAFRNRIAGGDQGVGLELSQLLYAWMREHVLKEDPVWSEFAKANRRRRPDPAPRAESS
jgi:hemerythrin-like metal-binding protein